MYEDLLALLSEETNKTALRLEQGEPFHQEDIIHKLTDISAEHQLLETKLLLYQKLSKRTKALEINQHQLYVYGKLLAYLQSHPEDMLQIATQSNNTQNLMSTIFAAPLYFRGDLCECQSLALLKEAVRAEFQSSPSHQVLFRRNSLSTALFCQMFKDAPINNFLGSFLTGVTQRICHHPNPIEFDPHKLWTSTLKTLYQSQRSTCPIDLGDVDRSDIDPLSNPLVQRIIGESVLEITELLDQFMVSFRESIPSAPYSLRWFCKQLFDLSKEFFPEREGTYFISGFIMLRLVCPILITPNVFFGVDPHQIPISARRSLLIYAMTLQNIANGNVNSHNNMHMAVLNPVIERNIPVLKDILMELASVEDLIPQRIASCQQKMQTLGNVFFLSLEQIYHVRNCFDLANQENLSHECVRLLRLLAPVSDDWKNRTKCFIAFENDFSPNAIVVEKLYCETKQLLVSILHSASQWCGSFSSLDELFARLPSPDLRDTISKFRSNCSALLDHGLLNVSEMLCADIFYDFSDPSSQAKLTAYRDFLTTKINII